MLNVSPKYRRPLSAKQIRLLKLVFKFRFVSVPLLAEYLGKDKSSVYENLYVLGKQGYIDKRYDKTYRLRGRPVSYCLSTTGIRYLRQNTKLSQKALRNMYKNKHMSEEHIDHCLTTLAVFNTINSQTNQAFNIFSRYELTDHEFFIRPLPDLYLVRKEKECGEQDNDQGKRFHYTLDIFDSSKPFWLLKRRLRQYQDHCDEAELAEGQSYPDVLLVPHSQLREDVLLELIYGMIQDFELYTTTIDRLLNPENVHKPAWRDAFEQEEDEPAILRSL